MQENIESFCEYFGIEHCFEFTVTAPRLTPAEFQKKWNSFVTNVLRDIMPDRIGVLEPHRSGHAHLHQLVVLPFTSPNFDHKALEESRKAHNRKDFVERRRLNAKFKASMSEEHRAMWDFLRVKLDEYELGGQIGFAPIRESGRAIARYFGKYLAKGIADRREDWKHVRLVRYSGTNAREVSPWKNSSPQRSGTSLHDTNRRNKMQAVAKECGVSNSEEMKELFGPRWFFFARELIARVQLPVYRSFLHAEADGLTLPLPHGISISDLLTLKPAVDLERFFPLESRMFPPEVDMSNVPMGIVFPPECHLPFRPPPEARRENALTPKEVANAILSQAAQFREPVRERIASLRED